MHILQTKHLKKYYVAGPNTVRALEDAVSYTHLTLPTTSRV